MPSAVRNPQKRPPRRLSQEDNDHLSRWPGGDLWQAVGDDAPRPPLMTEAAQIAREPDYEVRRLQGAAEMEQALTLRHDVFCVEQGVPEREELDGRDREGLHLVAVQDGELVGTCRLLFVGPTVQFSRLAVRRDARRRGIASALLRLADQETLAGGARRLVLHAQTYARALYDAAGYQPMGRVFMEAGIEHIAMEKHLG
jgi:predicted GNAT family N-acyltransferase